MAIVERELSVPLQVWQGHHLIDRLDRDESAGEQDADSERAQQNLQHVFALLASVLPREPLQVAFRGIRSEDAGLRGLALEYLDGVLPPGVRSKLWQVMEARVEDRGERLTPERALERLREATEIPLDRVRKEPPA